ncbi:actin cortical patch SUR7/pH-response regulator pali [Panaeolus papilionaceus]|nr:actin cortical patch SUR7/pH-response regulator pali [Panaeolus papilionaceus]
MASTAPLPGFLLCFAAMVLLIFVSVSVPTWDKVYFLTVGEPGPDQLKYGVFGFTGSSTHIGYHFTNDRLNSTILYNLTKTLILHPIAAGLAGIAAILGLLGFVTRIGTIGMTFFTGLAALTTFIAWVIDMILFGIARQRYRNESIHSQYGNANWLTLGALVALLLGFCASACGVFGRYRRRRGDVAY